MRQLDFKRKECDVPIIIVPGIHQGEFVLLELPSSWAKSSTKCYTSQTTEVSNVNNHHMLYNY